MCRKRLLRLLPPLESGAALDLVGAQKSSNLFFTTTRNDQFTKLESEAGGGLLSCFCQAWSQHMALLVSIACIPGSMFDSRVRGLSWHSGVVPPERQELQTYGTTYGM